MRLKCTLCGKPVSSPVPEGFSIRAVIICPDCYRKQQEKKDENPSGVRKQ
jgi:ribosome-binding protein aMBF1 (putative translation factor)